MTLGIAIASQLMARAKALKRGVPVASVAVCSCALTLMRCQPIAAASSAIDAEQLATIEGQARQVAAASGDPSVSMEVAQGSLGEVDETTDPDETPPTITDPRTGLPWEASPVYVAIMKGHFTDSDANVPAGAASPTGTSLTVVVDVLSGRVVSVGLNDKAAPDLQRLGAVMDVEG